MSKPYEARLIPSENSVETPVKVKKLGKLLSKKLSFDRFAKAHFNDVQVATVELDADNVIYVLVPGKFDLKKRTR